MRPINALCNGFLGMFNLKQNGQQIRDLGEMLQPTIDIAQFYNSSETIELEQTIAANALGVLFPTPSTPVVVPAGKIWMVTGFGVYAQTAAGELLRMAPVIYRTVAASGLIFQAAPDGTSSLTDAVGAGIASTGYLSASQALIAPAGSALGVNVKRITTAGSINIFLHLRYRQIDS